MSENDSPQAARTELAHSRAALLAVMGYRKVEESPGSAQLEPISTVQPEPVTALSLARPVVRRWWTRQPAHEALEHAKPMMEDMARKHPFQFVAYGAGAGAALVLLKPWKWVPMLATAGLLIRMVTR